jgi:hypothetical protein
MVGQSLVNQRYGNHCNQYSIEFFVWYLFGEVSNEFYEKKGFRNVRHQMKESLLRSEKDLKFALPSSSDPL